MKNILIDVHYSGTRVCIVNDGRLEEFWMELKNTEKRVGNIYKGKVINVLQGMQAAFVDIGIGKNAFLYAGDICIDGKLVSHNGTNAPEKIPLKPGDVILCQILKDEFGTKGARVTMNITLPGRVLVGQPLIDYVAISRKILNEERRSELESFIDANRENEYGYIVRTEAENCTDEELRLEMNLLTRKWQKIRRDYITQPMFSCLYREGDLITRAVRDMMQSDVDKVIVNDSATLENIKNEFDYLYSIRPNSFVLYEELENIFSHYGVMTQIAELLKRKVTLKNGAYLVIDRTEALTVIDVNTGKYVGETNLEQTVYVTNRIAAVEIARQIRLRNLGGIIVVDFIDMTDPEHRAEILQILQDELNKDRVKCTLVGMTELGLVQITRKKTRNMIDEQLLQPCPYCKGDSYVYSEENVIYNIRCYLNDVFRLNNIGAVKLHVNPMVFNKLFSLRYLEKECETIWADKRIYVIPENGYHIERFEVEKVTSSVIDLPNSARMLY